MVWAGSTVDFTGLYIPRFNHFGQFEFAQNGIDADGEVGESVDIFSYLKGVWHVPQYLSWYVTATHATAVTDIVSIIVQGSVDGVNWDTVGTEITDADAANGGSAAEQSDVVSVAAFPTIGYRYFRANCTTVGSGNTLTARVLIW
jgi:hypothetical protein